MITGTHRVGFGLTEPDHGSDATWLETTARARRRRLGDQRREALQLRPPPRQLGHDLRAQRGKPGEARGITCFLVPTDAPGFIVELHVVDLQHAERPRRGDARRACACPTARSSAQEGEGLALANTFTHENRIRQAASSLGAAQYCVAESVAYARERIVFGKPLWHNQAIQFPLAELQTECEMVRALIHKTAWELDRSHHMDVTDKVSMCNYRANRLCCEAADHAIQVHGGIGYTRHKPFEHIYRHHRRYRITEGSEEIQLRRVAGVLFGRQAKR